MDLIDRVKELANRIETQQEHIKTEEATKTALVMPFLNALGYDVFNPLEVIPEFTADMGTKKGEKVDYAIKKDGAIVMLIECKCLGTDLAKEHASQLFRYFTVTDARFSILTNGQNYRFYSDLEQPNKMDSRPFFEFDLREFRQEDIEELKKFSKTAFSLGSILETANTLKYLRAAKRFIADEMSEPSEEFARLVTAKIYEGRITAPVLEQFKPIIRSACKQFLDDKVNERLKFALKTTDTQPLPSAESGDQLQADTSTNGKSEIVTTQDEREGYLIVKSILRQCLDISRVVMRDTKSYCGILLDDNNRKPICRLHFNYSQKYLGVINGKQEDRIPIASLNEIYQHADKLIATIKAYELAPTTT